MELKDILTKLNPAGIQKMIDDALAKVPGLEPFVGAVKYVPQGQEPPPGTTHTLEIVSVATKQKFQVALTVKAPYGQILDILVAIF